MGIGALCSRSNGWSSSIGKRKGSFQCRCSIEYIQALRPYERVYCEVQVFPGCFWESALVERLVTERKVVLDFLERFLRRFLARGEWGNRECSCIESRTYFSYIKTEIFFFWKQLNDRNLFSLRMWWDLFFK